MYNNAIQATYLTGSDVSFCMVITHEHCVWSDHRTPKDPKHEGMRCLPAPHPVYDLDSVSYPAGEEFRTRAKGRLHKGRIWGVIRLTDLVRLGFVRIPENG
jgi:hypothetical protein